MYRTAQANFKIWNDALKSKDYEKVASLYSTTDVSFLPTVSGEFIRDAPMTKAYFMEFLKKHPVGEITSDKVQSFGKDAYLHTGMYTFMVGPAEDRKAVDARFSYMWRKQNGRDWKIVHHHSSALPKGSVSVEEQRDKDEAMYPIAQANFMRWNDALKGKNETAVANLYSADDTTFLPTVCDEFIQDKQNTKDYFEKFLLKSPVGTITADKVQSFSDAAYLHSGLYKFALTIEGSTKEVEARFSYAWRKSKEGNWVIVHHHSSKKPEAVECSLNRLL